MEAGRLWPGVAATPDMVMLEIRRIDERLTCRAGLLRIDADLLKELIEARDELARLRGSAPTQAKATREKSSLVLNMEAHLLFAGYCEQEAARLNEKKRLLEAGAFHDLEAEKDRQWRERNEAAAERAIVREGESVERWQREARAEQPRQASLL